jgi:hypothetical protein
MIAWNQDRMIFPTDARQLVWATTRLRRLNSGGISTIVMMPAGPIWRMIANRA